MEQITKNLSAPDRPAPATISESHQGWHLPQPETLPQPTYWPAVLAIGIVFLLWGIVTTFIISGVGFVLAGLAIYGWVSELLHEY